MKKEITKDELEKLKVLNLLMWLQASLYAADECESIKWFYNHQTKMLIKRLNDSIQREHGKTITALWSTEEGEIMPDITRQMSEFSEVLAGYGYWMLPELTKLIHNAMDESEKLEVIDEQKVLQLQS